MSRRLKTRDRGRAGFTLIETLIYAVLTTLIVTFALMATYQIIAYGDKGKNIRELAENQKFLTQKIYWALQSVSAVNNPALGATTTVLSVNKVGYGSNPVVIDDLASTSARMAKGAGTAQPLTNNRVYVKDLTFHQFNFAGQTAIAVNVVLFNAVASTTATTTTTIILK